jgi:fructose-1,6-bisphosphatase/inositol monophosphatase family enzyme
VIAILALAAAIAASPAITGELSRLEGQEVAVAKDGQSYTIVDIAGEGRPRVGLVEERSGELWLVEEGGDAHRLSGKLAIPRIAGPGYKIWVIGELDGSNLKARRIGVLAPPR